MPVYELAPEDIWDLVDELIHEFHRDLHQIRIVCLTSDDSITSGGNITRFGVRKVPSWMTGFVEYDVAVWVEATMWNPRSDNEKRAIIDHCLSHLYLSESGVSIGKPPVQEFPEVARRWGPWNSLLKSLSGAINQHEQMSLFDNVEVDPETRTLTVNLDKEKANTDSVTLPSLLATADSLTPPQSRDTGWEKEEK